MRASLLHMPTLKEAPADAEIASHQLLIRGGFLRRLTSGIYVYLPLGLKVLNKIAAIVREEMNAAGAQEVLMPVVQPADLWQESGRWDYYGKDLLRFKDRHNRDYCLGPTHEEIITNLVRGEVRSYRQLPLNLYQVQTKFRDEIRPRFGLMRGREFMMKDAYSFDKDDDGADKSYWNMHNAYSRIFTRLGLKFRAVEADSGSIGGSFSHEFMIIADTGEDTIAVCTSCEYAANVERAICIETPATGAVSAGSYEKVDTPSQHTVEQVCSFFKVDASSLIKTLIYVADGKPVAVLVRGDFECNEVKVKNLVDCQTIELAPATVVAQVTNAPVGFAGPVGLAKEVPVYADLSLKNGTNWITGANAADAHYRNVDLTRDCTVTAYADLRNITATDPCPKCGAGIDLTRGIEGGHVFKLGTKYSDPLRCRFLDENGKEKTMIMGCYGIGVSRIVAASIEQNHDTDGIVFPPAIAPYDVTVISLDAKKEEVVTAANAVYDGLRAQGIDVLFDDRDERPGSKFKDADLIGIPMQIVVGGKNLALGLVEIKNRRTKEKTTVPYDTFLQDFKKIYAEILTSWNNG